MGDEKTRVSACTTEESISHDVSFLLSVNNEDTLHGLVNAYSRCILSARTGKLFIAEEDTRCSRGYCELACCNGAACGFICIVPRAKHQPRCGNDLALAALSRCVSLFLSLLPSRSSPFPTPRPTPVSRSCGRNYRIFSDTNMRLVDTRGWRRWY